MKKVLIAVLSFCMIFVLIGCNRNKVKDYKLTDNVTFNQTHFYRGGNEKFVVEISIGSKEAVFVADGRIDKVEPFSEISIYELTANSDDNVYAFRITSGETVINGETEKNIFTGAHVADSDLSSVKDGITAIEISSGAGSAAETVVLIDILAEAISWNDALNVAADEFKDRINAEKVDGILPREIYVKYVRDSRDPESPYYWYVSFVGVENNIWAVLLDPVNGAVLTKK
ncbi:MAG: hypothetical protein LBC13_03305 [Clostridiales bacterium]|nr:hypothetical protein [Clostridiales bacterium]